MENLFLDSNIWLDLYHFSSNDLSEFSKLEDMLNRDIKVFMPRQVFYEIQRNRANKINDAFKRFKEFKIQIPNLCKGFPEYETYIKLYKDILVIHNELCAKVEKSISEISLPVDELVRKLHLKSFVIEEDDNILDEAYKRYLRGNPPGKNNSYGDAINWISLLKSVPESEDLFFVSADKDYQSALNPNEMDLFLLLEWQKKKRSNVFYYSSLVQFLKEHIKDINLKSEREKESLIEQLGNSSSFAQTHELIGKLMEFQHFSIEQVNSLISSAEKTNQVYSIIDDPDLFNFYHAVIDGNENKLRINEENEFIFRKLKVSIPE